LLKKSAKISLEAKFKRALNEYEYQLPRQHIALRPVTPRDQARLLVYSRDTRRVLVKHFSDLPELLPARSVIVLNETRVVPARLVLTKETGGRVEILFLRKEGSQLVVLANKKLRVDEVVRLPGNAGHVTVTRHEDAYYWLRPSFAMSHLERILRKHGVMPLPPYLKGTGLSRRALTSEYQSVFARKTGAVAAPTASLHFTKRLLKEIEKRGHSIVFVTLHVGLGTFSPLTAEQWRTGKLHAERFEIAASAWAQLIDAKKTGRPIIAVGTTVARTLESVFASPAKRQRRGTTQLFIRPGYRFKMVDGLITNFHVPKSSLLMLVAALIGREKTFQLYDTALKKRFRFLSFGDGMLLL
jgi:S-adenosylmethionine:tRNA ribosyltransferase-isomerase